MNLKTKKIVAREFLLLLLCIAIGLFTFLGIYTYNSFKNRQVVNLKKEIDADEEILDSLQKIISLSYDEYGIPIRKYVWTDKVLDGELIEIVQRMMDAKEPEKNIALVIRAWKPKKLNEVSMKGSDDTSLTSRGNNVRKLFEVVKREQLYTKSYEEFKQKYNDPANQDKLYRVLSERQLYTKDVSSFKDKYFPKPIEVSARGFEKLKSETSALNLAALYKAIKESEQRGAKIKLEVVDKERLINESTRKLKTYPKQIIYSKRQIRVSLTVFYISLSCIFLLRYLFYGTTWSLRTLKEK